MIKNQGNENNPNIFKVLSHPSRSAILLALKDGEHCVCHLEAHLGYKQAYISQQLSVLRSASLVEDRREGWNIYYHVTKPEIFELINIALQIDHIDIRKIAPVDCPCPHCQNIHK
ncbi:MAG: ArsR family transcriptional regulator [Anaerolinea sp.]|nr:ArsR family transcriptional regulator [Anaerolinea sp.]